MRRYLRGIVVGHVPDNWVHPHLRWELDLVIAELQPGIDLGRLLERAVAHQSCVTSDARHVPGDGIGTKEGGGRGAIGNFQDGCLAGGRGGLNLGGVVLGDGDVDAGVFGGDERLEGAEVARDGVELVGGHGRCDGGWNVGMNVCWNGCFAIRKPDEPDDARTTMMHANPVAPKK